MFFSRPGHTLCHTTFAIQNPDDFGKGNQIVLPEHNYNKNFNMAIHNIKQKYVNYRTPKPGILKSRSITLLSKEFTCVENYKDTNFLKMLKCSVRIGFLVHSNDTTRPFDAELTNYLATTRNLLWAPHNGLPLSRTFSNSEHMK